MNRSCEGWAGAVVRVTVFAVAAPIAAAQSYQISNVPLVVPSALEPNITLTLDNSPGMANAFPLGGQFESLLPKDKDGKTLLNAIATEKEAGALSPANTRRFKSSTFNPLYYNPNIRYVIPEGALSASMGVTSFSAAWINGFFVGSGDKSNWQTALATAYRPTLSYDASGTAQSFANHACADLSTLNSSWSCTNGNPSPTNAPTSGAPAYYANFNTSACDINSSADRSNDACYLLVVIRSTTPSYTIPNNGQPFNGRPECSTSNGMTTCTFAQESQNFAIWYSYYRTRHLAMVSSAWRVMSDTKLIGARVAWQDLHVCNQFNTGNCSGFDADSKSVGSISNLIDEFSPARREQLRNWLRGVRPAASGTSPAAPLRAAMHRVGAYYAKSTSPNNPYRLFPQQAASQSNTEYACRPNFHLMMAGGSYDDADTTNYRSTTQCAAENADGTVCSLPDGVSYSGVLRPFADGNANSLADVAFHYWASDLRTDLGNVLLPYIRDRSGKTAAQQYWGAKNDPARWQHMVNFTVGIGLGATLTVSGIPWTGDSFGGPGYEGLLNGKANWPPTTAGSVGRMYDLWHAALNSRGEFFSADDPVAIQNAMNAALARTIEQADVGASLAANSTRLTTESTLYQASFSTGCIGTTNCLGAGDWTGRLRAISVNTDGSLGKQLWDATASGKIPAAGSRKIFTASGLTTGIDFTWSALTAAGLHIRVGDEATLNYLRGDQSNELANGGMFRDRSVRLGDIVNSDIAFAGTEDFGYEALFDKANPNSPASAAGAAYADFVKGKKGKTKLVIVGANDGMLHGFDADTGNELFAYVPRAVLLDEISPGVDPRSNLVRLADPGYTHRFYVDGSPWVGDAYIAGTWRTVVVGTTGAGGRGVFALDITDPDAMSASKVLWDLAGTGDTNLGFSIGQPVIGRLTDGNFYAIFGNGYKSTNECPVLYLVRLGDGAVRRVATGGRKLTDSCAAAEPSGLGRPSLYDADSPGAVGYRTTDFVYAGDLRGNVWRFDLSKIDPTNDDTVAKTVSVNLLFSPGGNLVQPITGLIEIGAAPKGFSGAMLWFGTGRWFAIDDRTDITQQTMYGILDRFANSQSATSPTTTRAKLAAQTMNISGVNAGKITGAAVDYNKNQDGWFIDLPRPGERMVSAPLVQPGRLVFPTLIPDEDKCAGGGTSSVVAIDPYIGVGLSQKFFLNPSYVTLDFIASSVGIVRNLAYIGTGAKAYLYIGGSTASSSTGSSIQFERVRAAQDAGPRGRVSWREIIK